MEIFVLFLVYIGSSAAQFCQNVGPGFPTGLLQDSELNEASGLAASRASNSSQILYTHNDSGEVVPKLYVMDQFGTSINKIEIEGYSMVDFEDITIGAGGPIQGQDYIYLGDFGNNYYDRLTFEILRFQEPSEERLRFVFCVFLTNDYKLIF